MHKLVSIVKLYMCDSMLYKFNLQKLIN